MSKSGNAKRHRLLTHGLVAVGAIVAGYFFQFYFYHYVFPPSVPASAQCSPGVASYLASNGKGERIRMVESHCVPEWSDIGLYLEDANGRISPAFLVSSGQKPAIHAAWTSPGNISVEMTANDISIEYALNRFEGFGMSYTLHEIPAATRR